MNSKLKNIELIKEFPCLMMYNLQGSIPIGVYLVNQVEKGDKYSVCLISPVDDISKLGETYFKEELNYKEWQFLPKGTQITLTN